MSASVPCLIERTAANLPEAIAVRDGGRAITYQQLCARADALARALLQTGARPGALVGLCVRRSAALVVGALGIMRAGAAYVATDPAYPPRRLQFMLDDAQVAATVTDGSAAGRLSNTSAPLLILGSEGELDQTATPAADAGKVVAPSSRWPGAHRSSAGAPALPPPPAPSELAYVVYTSGSTGEPKGAMIEHAGLTNLVDWHLRSFELTAADRTTQIASPGFDAAVWEIWPALACGASVHIVPAHLRQDPVGLRDWILAEGITVSFLPTVLAEAVVALRWPARASLRYLLTGGEALTRRPPPGLPFTLVNNYGLSETTVVATSGTVKAGTGVPTIGRPIAGVHAEVLDESLHPVPDGEPGELVIGGVAVARGYLRRPQLTAERFLTSLDGGRRYRTGDRVRRRQDGELEFLGRLDDQLSIRGVRVEPGEIAAALRAHPQVATAAVRAAAGQLVAYLVCAGPAQPDRAELELFLAQRLPAELLPSHYVWLEELPLTAHGKVDREALPPPQRAERQPAQHQPAPPQPAPPQPVQRRPAPPSPAVGNGRPANGKADGGEVAAAISAIMAGLLGREQIEAEENFFLLGGHSMLGAQLISALQEAFGVEIGLRYLFDHPTVAAVATEVQRQLADTGRGGR